MRRRWCDATGSGGCARRDDVVPRRLRLAADAPVAAGGVYNITNGEPAPLIHVPSRCTPSWEACAECAAPGASLVCPLERD